MGLSQSFRSTIQYRNIYEGKGGGPSTGPLGTRVVKQALSICKDPCTSHVYFDNFFTSYGLMKEMTDLGFHVTGTVRDNRTMNCPLTSMNEMKKKERGSMDYRSCDDISVVRWNDNAVVTLCSNVAVVNPVATAKRWKHGVGKSVCLSQQLSKYITQVWEGLTNLIEP